MIEESAYTNQLSIVNCQLSTLPVMETFYSLQGEGFHQGKAAYFIRLGGCDVGCFWCDVKESWDATSHQQKTIEQIVEEAKSIIRQQTINSNCKSIIVITGGEPLLHNLDELTKSLQQNNFKTHLETSGSSQLSGSWNWICLSPKKFKDPLPEVFSVANELKIIVYNKNDFSWAEKNAGQVSPNCKLYLQPEWSKSAQITPLIIDYIKANPQWQLSLQIHKYANIP